MAEQDKCFTEEYVAQVVHDLKTPVLSIGGYAKRLREEKLGSLNEAQKDALDTILQTAERLEHDLGWIVEHAAAGEFVWEQAYPVRFDLKDHVAKVVETARVLADRNRQTLELELPDHSTEVEADSRMIDRAVSELVYNALKNSYEGAVVRVSLEEQGDRVVLAVKDEGEGFDPEKLKQAFQPWEQVIQTEDRTIRGVGLGLANVKRYTEAHGGEIQADTSPGRGSTFRLLLPLKKSGGNPEG
jgi:signal transduction histidine kinase